MNQKDLSMKTTEWKSIDYIKTQEELDAYVEEYIASIKEDLEFAIDKLTEIATQTPQSGQARLMVKSAKQALDKIGVRI